MNYRHAFHAGNFADVFKHVILARIVVYLARKDAPFRVIDTHAGEGLYDLSSAAAEQTGEWRAGIGRLLAASPPSEIAALLAPYLAVAAPLAGAMPPRYPGSPALAARLSRPQDRLIFCETQPEVVTALRAKARLGRDPRVKIVVIDGYQGFKAFLPPPERRGLVLIDPPFESRLEFETLAAALAQAVPKWPAGIYAIWFPIKDLPAVGRFRRRLMAALPHWGIGNALELRLAVGAPHPEAPLAAAGLIILNPPFTLGVEAQLVLPYLAKTMATMGRGDAEVAWLAKH